MGITTISAKQITRAVKLLCLQANFFLPEDVFKEIQTTYQQEKSDISKSLLEEIIFNAYLAMKTKRPICQDTGLTVIFVDIGQNINVADGDLTEAINKGVKLAYSEGFLRKSIVDDPLFKRKNTGTNTPAIIHTKIVPGNEIKLIVAPKGGGSENMSAVKMLKPAQGVEGVTDFVLDTVKSAGPNPCPPIVVGVGIGGSMEYAAYLAKKALTNKLVSLEALKAKASKDQKAQLELKLYEEIQKTGVGTQGLGGTNTSLGVSVEMHPCHIASLPVAVNINCHAARHAEMTLTENTTIPEELVPEFNIVKPEFEDSSEKKTVQLPLSEETINNLQAGDSVLLNGYIYTARDAAHKKLINLIKENKPLPIDLKGETIYYVGPCPAKEDEVIGPAGPTTSGRMDAYTPTMLDNGLKGMIGKGFRNTTVIESIKKHKALYFVATGGGAVLLANCIKECELIAYPELGPEAIYKLKLENFPATVCIDSQGNNYYETGISKYNKQ